MGGYVNILHDDTGPQSIGSNGAWTDLSQDVVVGASGTMNALQIVG